MSGSVLSASSRGAGPSRGAGTHITAAPRTPPIHRNGIRPDDISASQRQLPCGAEREELRLRCEFRAHQPRRRRGHRHPVRPAPRARDDQTIRQGLACHAQARRLHPRGRRPRLGQPRFAGAEIIAHRTVKALIPWSPTRTRPGDCSRVPITSSRGCCSRPCTRARSPSPSN